MTEPTAIGQAITATPSTSVEPCEKCVAHRRHRERKWCRSCILAWQRTMSPDQIEQYIGTIPDSCPDWRAVVPERFWGAALEHLPTPLTERIKALPVDRGVYLWGPVGAGKTYAAAAALKHLWVCGCDIGWQPFEELLLRLRDTFSGTGVSEWSVIQPVCDVDVLLLDDIGCTVSGGRQESDFSVRTLLVLLDHRIAHCKRTFATGNKPIEAIRKSFDARIASRLCQACDVLKVAGSDRRLPPEKAG